MGGGRHHNVDSPIFISFVFKWILNLWSLMANAIHSTHDDYSRLCGSRAKQSTFPHCTNWNATFRSWLQHSRARLFQPAGESVTPHWPGPIELCLHFGHFPLHLINRIRVSICHRSLATSFVFYVDETAKHVSRELVWLKLSTRRLQCIQNVAAVNRRFPGDLLQLCLPFRRFCTL